MGRVALTLITEPRYGDARIVRVVRACASIPGFCVQLRDHTDRTDDELLALAKELRAIAPMLVVNRRFDLARRIGADGVHALAAELGGALDFAFRSAPVHTDEELQNATHATCVLVSPIYAVPGKDPPRGIAAIRVARTLAPGKTILALGGIDETNARACRAAGADGVAVIRALFDARDPGEVAKRLAV